MCGITGLISSNPLKPADIAILNRMNDALVHRGPDSMGFYQDTNIALAMRRLKIIDLAGGNQPLYNEDGSLVLVANGEIYNYIELRKEMENRGHKFKTQSDCEPILHLYEESGEACLQNLRGMFAFALFDKKRQTLFIARDRLSEKPLYYYKTEDGVVFSSEMKSLLVCLREKDVRLNPDAVNMYFHYQYVPEPYTCIEGVLKLPAAHYMMVSLNPFEYELRKYWDFEDVKPVSGNPSQLIREAFEDLSGIIIRSDVPVGISLSGGIDSSAIAVLGARYYKEKMHAFSVGYPGHPQNDEREMAMGLSNQLGFSYHEIELNTEDLVNSFPEMVYAMDDPIADIAAFGYYSVNKLARRHNVPVILSGIGGDELFWGYLGVTTAVEKNLQKQKSISNNEVQSLQLLIKNIYTDIRNIGKRQQMIPAVISVINNFKNIRVRYDKVLSKPDTFILYDDDDFLSAFGYLETLYREEFKQKIQEEELFSFFTGKDWDEVPIEICKILYQTWLYSNCVALGDRMSMASSVELRLPFLDYRFVELIMGLRKTYKDDYKLGYKKWFIDAMKGIVPDEILNRRKRGFTPPVKDWYNAVISRYGSLCHDGCLVSGGVVKRDAVMAFIDRSISRGEDLFFSYKIILMEMWCRIFIRGEDPNAIKLNIV
ncbi:MAG: asparagine synthase (glutamine-hydrolyzing) [Nitrospirae bacterium]|nr:asparagine synthase (glutamine-hydrolyzing) [Nitrospirota bacterium]